MMTTGRMTTIARFIAHPQIGTAVALHHIGYVRHAEENNANKQVSWRVARGGVRRPVDVPVGRARLRF